MSKIDRRSMLERSAAAALAAAAFETWMPAPAEAGQNASGTAPARPSHRFRRVVTGNNAEGKSYVVSDDVVEQAHFWTTAKAEPVGVFPGELPKILPSTRPDADPPAGGTRALLASFPAGANPRPNVQNRIGFHRTGTIDYFFVLSGEIVLLLDTQEVALMTGDMLIQRNTTHSWRNDGPMPARAFAVMVRLP